MNSIQLDCCEQPVNNITYVFNMSIICVRVCVEKFIKRRLHYEGVLDAVQSLDALLLPRARVGTLC